MMRQSLPIPVAVGLAAAFALGGCKKGEEQAPAPEVVKEAPPKVEEPAGPPKFGFAWANVGDDRRQAAFASGDKLSEARSLLTYELLRNAQPSHDGAAVGPLALVLKDNKTRDFSKEARIGMRRARGVVVQQSRLAAGGDLNELCGSECQRTALNGAFEKFAGASLLDAEGRMNEAALSKLLAAFYIEPEAKLLGLEAREIYTLIRPSVRDVAGVYVGLNALGHDEVLKTYRAALEANPEPESGVNRGLIKFYKTFTNTEGIAAKGGLEPSSSHWTIVSFWLRRMNEGTDKVLREYLVRGLKDYDPAAFKEYFGAGEGDDTEAAPEKPEK